MEVLKPESPKIRWLQAENYMRSKQIAKALEVFEGLAAEGYSEACVEIGNILEQHNHNENGSSPNLDKARGWYMRAIDEIGDPNAYIGLARLALNGYGDAGSTTDAVEYLNIAIKANNPIAHIILGTLYHSGKGVPRDLSKAAKFYEEAIEQGYVLPLGYLSQIEWENGHYFKSLRLRMKKVCQMYKLVSVDRHDSRLWHCLD